MPVTGLWQPGESRAVMTDVWLHESPPESESERERDSDIQRHTVTYRDSSSMRARSVCQRVPLSSHCPRSSPHSPSCDSAKELRWSAPRPDMTRSREEFPSSEIDGSPGPVVALCATGCSHQHRTDVRGAGCVAAAWPRCTWSRGAATASSAANSATSSVRRVAEGEYSSAYKECAALPGPSCRVAVDRHGVVGGGQAALAATLVALAVCRRAAVLLPLLRQDDQPARRQLGATAHPGPVPTAARHFNRRVECRAVAPSFPCGTIRHSWRWRGGLARAMDAAIHFRNLEHGAASGWPLTFIGALRHERIDVVLGEVAEHSAGRGVDHRRRIADGVLGLECNLVDRAPRSVGAGAISRPAHLAGGIMDCHFARSFANSLRVISSISCLTTIWTSPSSELLPECPDHHTDSRRPEGQSQRAYHGACKFSPAAELAASGSMAGASPPLASAKASNAPLLARLIAGIRKNG